MPTYTENKNKTLSSFSGEDSIKVEKIFTMFENQKNHSIQEIADGLISMKKDFKISVEFIRGYIHYFWSSKFYAATKLIPFLK